MKFISDEGDLPIGGPDFAEAMKVLDDDDPDVVAGMQRLANLREQEDEVRDLPARDQF